MRVDTRQTLDNKIKKILIEAFAIRMVMLIVIFSMQEHMEDGFIGTSTYYDDYRYELGAETYAKTANSLIDVAAFTQSYAKVDDWVGYKLASPFNSTPFWYWFACIILYVFRTKWVLRFINIVFAVTAILYVYRFVMLIYGERTALRTAKLLAFLPYPLIFSCFSYKDQLVMLITFFLLYKAAKYRKTNILSLKELIAMLVLALILMLTRSGLSIILFFCCVIIAFVNDYNFLSHIRKRLFIFAPLVLAVIIILFYRYGGTIIYKLTYYLNRHEETLTGLTLAFLTINSILDIYKFPFTYIFSNIMPIDMFSGLGSWYLVVSNLNIIMCPISIGAALYIFRKKPDNIVFWACFMLYAVSIVTSINIFRHYYSLLPVTLIAFSDFSVTSSRNTKRIYYLVSFVFVFVLLIFYGFVRGN